MPSAHDLPVVFQALIVPHRSLSQRGAFLLIGLITALTALVILRFWILGAWPVVLFSVLEVPLVVALLTLNMRRARASELILLNMSDLTVIRTDARGRRTRTSIPADWLNVTYSQPNARLLLHNRGREEEIGHFLHEPDKQSLHDALAAALHTLRHPRFDNPQLADG
jgi:hypothetical protein